MESIESNESFKEQLKDFRAVIKKQQKVFDTLTPEEFSNMRERVRIVEKSLGDGIKQPSSSEIASVIRFRKTMYAKNDIKKGTVINENDIIYTAPAYGIYAKYEDIVLGKVANRDISKNTPITWDLIS